MLRDLLFRLRSLLGRRQAEADLADELRFHADREAEKYMRAGLPPEDARRRARLAFGGPTQIREEVQDAWGTRLLEVSLADIRYGARLLRRSPTFTAAAILTMAVGIGATTAIFSLVDATLLRPLPYPNPGQLVAVIDDLPGVGAADVGLSQPEWLDLEHADLFSAVSPAWYDEQNLTGSSRPTRVNIDVVASTYFEVLGVAPALGHTFHPADRRPGMLPEVVISDGLWTRVFGRDPHVLARSVRLDSDLYQIAGVMPAGFHAPGMTLDERTIDVWAATSFFGMPLADRPPRNHRNLPETIGRLVPGLTVAQAQARLDGLVTALRARYPADYPATSAWTVRLVPLRDRIFGHVRQSLLLLLGAVGLVLLIGSVNVANLLLARASTRSREMAIRQALGANRSRLTRQLLVESLLLAGLGSLAGLAVLFAAKPLLLLLVPDGLPRLTDLSVRWTTWAVAFGTAVFTGVAFGLVPAYSASRVELAPSLKAEGRGSTASRGHARTRRILVIAECALSLTLMVASALLLRSFWAAEHARLGFTPDRVLSVRTRLPYPNHPDDDLYRTLPQKATFLRAVLDRMRTLAGVEEAAVGNATSLPLDHHMRDANLAPVFLANRPPAPDASFVDRATVTPEYFHLLGITLVRGRLFTNFDDDRTAPVAVVNEAMAARYWPGEDPIGQRLKLSATETAWVTVVGLVDDARVDAVDEARVPEIYASLYQRGDKRLTIFLRGHLDLAALPDAVRAEVERIDPTLPIFDVRPLTTTVAASLAPRRLSMTLVGLFGLTALLLTGIGLYGVIAYMVGERTQEIGIRLALGASRRQIFESVLGQAIRLACLGTAVGLVGALVVSHLMASVLYGTAPTDPLVFTGVVGLLAAMAVVAGAAPAWRATCVDPVSALR